MLPRVKKKGRVPGASTLASDSGGAFPRLPEPRFATPPSWDAEGLPEEQKNERAISWGDSPLRGVHVLRAHGAGHRDLRQSLPPRVARLALATPSDITTTSGFPGTVRRFASPLFTILNAAPFRRDNGLAIGPRRPELCIRSLPSWLRCYLSPTLVGSLDHRPSASFD